MLILKSGVYEIIISDDPGDRSQPPENAHEQVLLLDQNGEANSRRHVTVHSPDGDEWHRILVAFTWSTTIHDASALARGEMLYVVCGDTLCALALPRLDYSWHVAVFPGARCFGVYAVPGIADVVVHGELSIARLTSEGGVVWSVGGKDIFTGPFSVTSKCVRAIDFNGEPYRFAIGTGESLPIEV